MTSNAIEAYDRSATEETIEAGATERTLRLWQAREAIRQAELRLTAQAGSLQAFEVRATAMLGWIALAVSTLAGAAIVSLDAGKLSRSIALSAALIPSFVAALYASRLLWPKQWGSPGYAPDVVMDTCESELQQLDYLIGGYAAGIGNNKAFLEAAGDRVRIAWWALLAIPFTAGVAIAITWGLGV